MEDLERTLIGEEKLQLFENFRKHTLESVYADLNKVKHNHFTRFNNPENIKCANCPKKAIYIQSSSDTRLCWYCGYQRVKEQKNNTRNIE